MSLFSCRRILAFGLAGLAACAPSTSPLPAAPPPDAPDVLDVVLEARAARLRGDLPEYARQVALVESLVPGHPPLLGNLARAYAAAGDTAGAMRTLLRIAPLGMAADLSTDTAFALLRAHPGFAEVARRLAARAAPIVRSDTAFTVPDPDLLPEAIAHDPAEGVFYLGSLAKNKVVRVVPGGGTTDFAQVGSPGRVIGLRVDPARRVLWVATTVRDSTAPPTFGGTGGWTALHRYDLRTGALTGRFAPPRDPVVPRLFNDLAVSRGGDVYVTDTNGSAVYRVRAGVDTLEVFHPGDPRFHWPNGIALSPDESRLYVAHMEGVSVWELPGGGRRKLAHPPEVAMADIDGLYACRKGLVTVQRMTDFEQVTRLRLSPEGAAVAGAEVLERRHPAYRDPTTGVTVGDTLYYVANAQVRRLNDGLLVPTDDPRPTVVLGLPLGEECRPEP